MPSNLPELLTQAQLDNACDVYKLIESRSGLNPHQGRELSVEIVDKLARFHSNVVSELMKEGKAESVAGRSIDLHKL